MYNLLPLPNDLTGLGSQTTLVAHLRAPFLQNRDSVADWIQSCHLLTVMFWLGGDTTFV